MCDNHCFLHNFFTLILNIYLILLAYVRDLMFLVLDIFLTALLNCVPFFMCTLTLKDFNVLKIFLFFPSCTIVYFFKNLRSKTFDKYC